MWLENRPLLKSASLAKISLLRNVRKRCPEQADGIAAVGQASRKRREAAIRLWPPERVICIALRSVEYFERTHLRANNITR